MTKPIYPAGWLAGSKDHGKASSPSDYAWYVNFNNGNSNYYNQNNECFVRAVRSSECQGAVSLRLLHAAWRQARRGKKPSHNQLAFESRWADNLLDLQAQLNTGAWCPRPPTCFVAHQPKAREIHAPDFADRVVHHWLVPQLETIYEPVFIFDSFSNRKGKGTHAAVDRLQQFVREVHSGQGGGWYLQLDIHNFFNSIHRPTLYALLKDRMTRHGLSEPARRATHALLRQSPARDCVRLACTPSERALVPIHKRLENAATGCGIAIGNLSSQFFANVYLNELDQFVKHELKAERYVRYVDDFVLMHHSREQLQAWHSAIVTFLGERLQLRLKAEQHLKPLRSGIDFLGFIIHPTHRTVRRRVVHHARQKLSNWQQRHVGERSIDATPAQFRELRSIWSSYVGHFAHANAAGLITSFHRRFSWLRSALLRRRFDYRLEGKTISIRGAHA
jgi:retron-type reverse transcriptase